MENISQSLNNSSKAHIYPGKRYGKRMSHDLSHNSRVSGAIAPYRGSDHEAHASHWSDHRTSMVFGESLDQGAQPRGLTGRDTGHDPIPLHGCSASAVAPLAPSRKPGLKPSVPESAPNRLVPINRSATAFGGQYNPVGTQFNPYHSNPLRAQESRPMSHAASRKAKLTVRARGNLAHGNNHYATS
jgi:hypothetical protein